MIKVLTGYLKFSSFNLKLNFVFRLLMGFPLLILSSCSNMPAEDNNQATRLMFTDFERKIAQKIILDIRYFCDESPQETKACTKGVLKLPKALDDLVQETDIGGVVLFAENLASNEQVIQLTQDLQNAALKSQSAKPLIISIDQEGGRVVRLPQATSFSGNMAIGATYAKHNTQFSTRVNQVIATELKALGINNNYAPVVDVNTNANNPVINTRSFGEDPQQVSELGAAAVKAMQSHGVMATLKHFPGHGDTSVDSHLGLPRVDHNLAKIEKVDLAPFKWAIAHSEPAMIMTAHIQYPALDNSTFISKDGIKTVKPATMSRKILTDLLRNEMAFKGIIATDALDMAGVAHYFDQVTATVETIAAGADLVVMPFKVRTPADIDHFKRFVIAVSKGITNKISTGSLTYDEIDESIARLNHYKDLYIQTPPGSISQQIESAQAIVASDAHIAEQQQLSNEATTLLKNNTQTLPLSPDKVEHIHLLVANEQEQQALQNAIVHQWQRAGQRQLKITSIIGEHKKALAKIQNINQLKDADLVITTLSLKKGSVVDLGGVDDLLQQAINQFKSNKGTQTSLAVKYGQLAKLQLALAKEQSIPSLLIVQGSPFLVEPYLSSADSAILIYDDKIMMDAQGQQFSAGMNASMAIATGVQQAKGVLPVSL